MFGTHDLWAFVISGLLLNITPGPDTLYIVGRSSTQGPQAGAVAALGIGTGTLVHILAASFGLSAILAASATAFMAVKLIGAGYLVYVGISLIRSSSPMRPSAAPAPASMRGVYLQGFFTNVLNPKVALFFLAFLPQFVLTNAPSKPLALLFLGVIFDLNGTLWNLLVAWSAARFSARITGARRTGYGRTGGRRTGGRRTGGGHRRNWPGGGALIKWFNRSVGGLFICVGIKLALTSDR